MPSARARFCYVNRALSATVTASSAVADRPASYLTSSARWRLWRSATGTGDQTLEFDFGATRTIQVVALVDWRAHTGGTIAAETWDGSGWDAFGTFTLADPNPTGVIAVWVPAGVATSKVRLVFDNVAAADEYVQLGAALMGAYFEPEYTLSDGFEITPVDPSLTVAAVDGQEETQTRTMFHVIRGTWEDLDGADLAGMRALYASVGTRTPFLAALDPDDAGLLFYARLTDLTYQHLRQDVWTFPMSLQEVR